MSSLTKVLIVLQLVFALVCSVLLVLMVSKQENYKLSVDAANAKCTGLQAMVSAEQGKAADFKTEASNARVDASRKNDDNIRLEAKLSQVQAGSDASVLELKNQIASLEAKNRDLSAANSTLATSVKIKDDQLNKVLPEIEILNSKYGQTNKALSERENLLRAAENTIKRLQEQLAQLNTSGAGSVAPLGSGSQITTFAGAAPGAAQVNGTISSVETAAGRTLVELPLGTRDGLQVSNKLYVYRGTGYVGEAEILSVTPDQSIALVTSTKPGETVQKGDLVATVNK